jgi:hypothetical protein
MGSEMILKGVEENASGAGNVSGGTLHVEALEAFLNFLSPAA